MEKIKYVYKTNPFLGIIVQALIEKTSKDDRVATCSICGLESLSSKKLPLFIAKPKEAHDEYYCGCRGWE